MVVTKRRKVDSRIVDPFASDRMRVQPAGALTVGLPRTAIEAIRKSPVVTPAGTGTVIKVEATAAAELAATNVIGIGVGEGVGAGVGLGVGAGDGEGVGAGVGDGVGVTSGVGS